MSLLDVDGDQYNPDIYDELIQQRERELQERYEAGRKVGFSSGCVYGIVVALATMLTACVIAFLTRGVVIR